MSRRGCAMSLSALSFFLGFALTGCMETSERGATSSDASAKKPLYDRLGGEAAITKVVDDFVGRAASDPKVNFTRKGTAKEWQATDANVSRFKKMLVQFIASVTGSPQKYTGKDMKTTHVGMKISGAEFDALAADLKASLDALKVPAPEQEELLQIVGSTRKDIVE